MAPKKEELLLRSVEALVQNAYENENVAIYHDLNAIGASTLFYQRCDLALVWAQGQLNHNSMVAQKHSPFTAIMKHSTMGIFQKGLSQRDIRSQALPTGSSGCRKQRSIGAITWQKVLSVAIILALGAVFAVIICSLEIVFSAKRNPGISKQDVGLKMIDFEIEAKQRELEELVRRRALLI